MQVGREDLNRPPAWQQLLHQPATNGLPGAEIRQQRNTQPCQHRITKRFAVIGGERAMNLDTQPFARLLAGLKRPLRALPPARIGQALMMAQRLRRVQATKTADILCRGDNQRRPVYNRRAVTFPAPCRYAFGAVAIRLRAFCSIFSSSSCTSSSSISRN
ncbi:hypothetical protein STW0522RAO56_17110 [Raoultella planticola]|nr:hypothetical protein STW0522RAO56_17110 [Raoultella planticola]